MTVQSTAGSIIPIRTIIPLRPSVQHEVKGVDQRLRQQYIIVIVNAGVCGHAPHHRVKLDTKPEVHGSVGNRQQAVGGGQPVLMMFRASVTRRRSRTCDVLAGVGAV